jgi:hypothetical protein
VRQGDFTGPPSLFPSPSHARQIRQDVEALTGLKTAQLFKLLDVRGNGYLVVEARMDEGCR